MAQSEISNSSDDLYHMAQLIGSFLYQQPMSLQLNIQMLG